MASSAHVPMLQNIDGYKKLAQEDLELIMKMKDEIKHLRTSNKRLSESRDKLHSQCGKLKYENKNLWKSIVVLNEIISLETD